jgi:hypothetical protein
VYFERALKSTRTWDVAVRLLLRRQLHEKQTSAIGYCRYDFALPGACGAEAMRLPSLLKVKV